MTNYNIVNKYTFPYIIFLLTFMLKNKITRGNAYLLTILKFVILSLWYILGNISSCFV